MPSSFKGFDNFDTEPNGSILAWCHVRDAYTGANQRIIVDSYNVSAVTNINNFRFSITYENALPNVNYNVHFSSSFGLDGTGLYNVVDGYHVTPTNSSTTTTTYFATWGGSPTAGLRSAFILVVGSQD